MYINRYADRLLEENRELKRKIEQYESEDMIRQMRALCDKRVSAAAEREKRQHDGWMKCLAANKELKKKNTALWKENTDYKSRLRRSINENERIGRGAALAEAGRRQAEETIEKLKLENEEKDEQIKALKEELCRIKAELDHDGTTNGIPTSQTPRDKKKVIPNTRERSGRKRGGQPGHRKSSMTAFEEEEVTEEIEHTLECCPECGGRLEELVEEKIRDEADYEVQVIKKRHRYRSYRCMECGKTVHAPIPQRLRSENQYGPAVQAMALALVDLGFVSIGRTRQILNGMLGGKLQPSEGFIGKVQKKAARMLTGFREEVRKFCLTQRILHWDDTVVFMNTVRACFRFYGNEMIALYYAHASKDAAGIQADGVLANLTEKTCLMHDHVKYNYRKEFLFQNIECVQHLERELQQVYNDTGHEWAKQVKKLIGETIHMRKEYLKAGREGFTEEETNRFEEELERYVSAGDQICEETKDRYFYTTEKNAIRKINEYRENYFAWVYDFSLPTTNNVAESGLRMTKSKLKISGQFLKEETAEEFAIVRTYTETCKRNGINVFHALERLMAGNPYTLAEVLAAE